MQEDLVIDVTGVTKRFGETTVLSEINLDIPQGKVSCLIGPSGSGKDTVITLSQKIINKNKLTLFIETP